MGKIGSRKIVLVSLTAVCMALVAYFVFPSFGLGEKDAKCNLVFSLVKPALAQGDAVFPSDEAGISAYVNTGTTMDLSKIKSLFKAITAETDNYVIGTIELTGLPVEAFPYVYISRDGWVVSYYQAGTVASMIMPWSTYDGGAISSTTLQDAISQIFSAIGIDYEVYRKTISYWHFRYQEATNLLLFADKEESSTWNASVHDMTYTIPFGTTVYQGSWSLKSTDSDAYFIIDATSSYTTGNVDHEETKYAPIESKCLTQGKHTVRFTADNESSLSMAFIYR